MSGRRQDAVLRAASVWIVQDLSRQPVAAFTFRQELKLWLQRQDNQGDLTVYRMPDGRPGDAFGMYPAKDLV